LRQKIGDLIYIGVQKTLALRLRAKVMLCKKKTSISGVHTFWKLNSDGLYPNFAHDLPASKIAEPSNVSRPMIKQLLFRLRTRTAQLCGASSPFSGEVEVDESSFSVRRVCGKKGRGAGGKTIVFGILERHGKGYTEIPNAAKKPLQAAIRGQVP